MCRAAETPVGRHGRAADGSTTVDLWVYTNGVEAELLVNNKSLGRKPVANLSHAAWERVPYVPGRVEARTYRHAGDATPMATDAVETVGPARVLKIGAPVNLEQTEGLQANGVDVAFFQVAVVDAAGRVVPSASDNVTFSVSGPGSVVGGGNGDPACHVPDHAATRPAYHGRVMGIVRADDTGKASEITVTASATGLSPATFELKLVAAEEVPRL
jgi:beta-galactosidase